MGRVKEQDKTWEFTRLRVQAELALICAGVSCVKNPAAAYPPITSADIKAAICQALSGVTASIRGHYTGGNRRLLQTETLADVGAQGLYKLLTAVVSDLYAVSPNDRITNVTLGSNYSANATFPAYIPASVWTSSQLSLSAFQAANHFSSDDVATFQIPDSYANLLGLVFNATQGSVGKDAFTQAAALLALPTSALSTDASVYPALVQHWSAVMDANNLTSLQVSPNAFDGEGGLPIQSLTLSSNSTAVLSFQYVITGSTATSTVTGQLVVNSVPTYSTYALLTGCYPVLGVYATRVLVASNLTVLLNQSVLLVAGISKIVNLNAQPDNCLFLQAGQLPLDAGGWLLTRAGLSFGLFLNGTANGSTNSVSLRESGSTGLQLGNVLGSSLSLNGTLLFSSGSQTPVPATLAPMLLNATVCLLWYSLPGSVDYPSSVSYAFNVQYGSATVSTSAGVAVQLVSGAGVRTFVNRFGVSSSTLLSLSASADNLLYLHSRYPVDSTGLTLELLSPVQLPGVGPAHLLSQLSVINASGVVLEAGSSRVDALGQSFVSSVPGFTSVGIGASNANALAVSLATCQAPISFTNGLRPPTQPVAANGGATITYHYYVSDGRTYSVACNLTLTASSAFATLEDQLGNPYQNIIAAAGTRVYTYLTTNAQVVSSITGLSNSPSALPSATPTQRFYPYSLLASSPNVYTTNTAPFLDQGGLQLSISPSAPTTGAAPGTGQQYSSMRVYMETTTDTAVLADGVYTTVPDIIYQQQVHTAHSCSSISRRHVHCNTLTCLARGGSCSLTCALCLL